MVCAMPEDCSFYTEGNASTLNLIYVWHLKGDIKIIMAAYGSQLILVTRHFGHVICATIQHGGKRLDYHYMFFVNALYMYMYYTARQSCTHFLLMYGLIFVRIARTVFGSPGLDGV